MSSGALSCPDALERIRRYLTNRLDRGETRGLRAHLATCGECRDEYRSSLLVTARLAREKRLDREARRAAKVRRVPRFVQSMPRRQRMRLLLIPAFVAFLLSMAANLGVPQGAARLTATRGAAQVGERQVEEGDGPVPLGRGDWCSTDREGSARIEFLACSVELGESTWVLVELPRSRRLRLDSGRLDVDGNCVVSTELGVVAIESGKARLHRAAGRLDVESLEGALSVVDGRGERRLTAGELWSSSAPVAR